MQTFWVSDRVKVKLTDQRQDHSQWEKICDTDRSRRGKIIILKSKAFSFYTWKVY